MTAALLGKKIGMTQIYDENGVMVPVTVIQAGPCPVMQVKTKETDGYWALQLGYDDLKRSRQKAPQIGHAKKASATAKRFIREIRLAEATEKQAGEQLTVDVFDGIQFVDIVGTTKGKGFQGVMRRHGFKGQPASHGCERKHRSPGGIGANSGGRGTSRTIRKGKKMAGHMGFVRCTTRNQRLMGVDKENNILWVKGSIPGPCNGYVVVSRAKVKN